MFISFRLSRRLVGLLLAICMVGAAVFTTVRKPTAETVETAAGAAVRKPGKDFIKWVDFNVSESAMRRAMQLDTESHEKGGNVCWVDLLAVLGARYGGSFAAYREKDLTELAKRIDGGEKIEDITRDMKYYSYYREAYGAVLDEFVGEFSVCEPDPQDPEKTVWKTKYGLKAFSPIAEGYGYSHFDDFGASRSYGYKRKHLGHDMMGSVGTPIIAIESGVVEAIGWNRYGGWRIGIRSFDQKRYYYYAHLRKNHPYPETLAAGNIVKAGDVIGYLGMTGYSTKENVNNIDTPHLHMGMQLIFDESQKDGNDEIWIDCYNIVKLLSGHTSRTAKDETTGEYVRKYDFFEKSVENTE